MAQNVIIGVPSWTGELVFSGGAWQTAYPLANLARLPIARVARSVDAATSSTKFTATLAKSRPIRCLALVRHNLSLAGRFRLRLHADAALLTTVFDTGWLDVWPVVYPLDQCNWFDDFLWSGKYTEEQIAGYVWTRPLWLAQEVPARGLTLELDDPANPSGFVEIGRIEIAQGWQPSVNIAHGAEFGWRFRSLVSEALGGVRYIERREKPRQVRASIGWLKRDEALVRAFEWQRQSDLDQPFLWFPRPDQPVHWLRETFLARLTDPGPMAWVAHDRHALPIALEEVL